MSTKILYPPLYPYFFNQLFETQEDVLLVAPYIKLSLADKIVKVLEASRKITTISFTLITNVDTENLMSHASDVEAIELFVNSIPNSKIIGIGNLHAKCYIFDFKTAIITSGNLSPRGMHSNLEIGVQIDNENTARELRNNLLLKYGNQGTTASPEDLFKIKNEISQYHEVNAEVIEEHTAKFLQLTTNINKFKSKNIRLSTDETVSPEITSIISSKSRVLSYKAARASEASHRIPKRATGVLDNEWLKLYNTLVLYREVNPRYWPLLREEFENEKIGLWCADQRSRHKSGALSVPEENALSEIGFEFEYTKFIWEHRYNLLVDYRDEYPNQWPELNEIYHENALGRWCGEVAMSRHEISKDRVQRLDKLRFPFEKYMSKTKHTRPVHATTNSLSEHARWMLTFELLAIFQGKYDRFPTPQDVYPEGDMLYEWMQEQKRLYANNRLSYKQVKHLRTLKLLDVNKR